MRIHGFHPVREALRHRPHEVSRVLVSPSRGGSRRQEVEQLAARHRIPVVRATAQDFEGLEEAVHNGFAAELGRAEATLEPSGDADFLVLVEDVQDPRNLGALLRVCEGVGVGRVLIRDRGAAPITPTVVKTSAGAAEHLAVERVTNSAQTIERLQGEGFWVYGVSAEGDPPWDIDLKGKVVLAFGGEHEGLRDLTRRRCDRLIGLPMRGRVESLNLATAAAAVLYEAVRQRSTR